MNRRKFVSLMPSVLLTVPVVATISSGVANEECKTPGEIRSAEDLPPINFLEMPVNMQLRGVPAGVHIEVNGERYREHDWIKPGDVITITSTARDLDGLSWNI